MGGLAGHINYLTDDLELTFAKMKKILRMTASGKLVGTEKIDGRNMYFGHNGKEATVARNKTNAKRGGMTRSELEKHEFQGGDVVREVFLEALAAVSSVLASLGNEIPAIFTSNGDPVFFNCEVVSKKSPNVVEYDGNYVVLHDSGHLVVRESGIEGADDVNVGAFREAIGDGKRVGDVDLLPGLKVSVPELEDTSHLKIVNAKIDSEASKYGLSGGNTIRDYMTKRLDEQIRSEFSGLSDELYDIIVQWFLKTRTLRDIPKETASDIRNKVRSIATTQERTRRMNLASAPLAEAVTEFAAKALETLSSALSTGGEEPASKLRTKVESAIEALRNYSGEHGEYIENFLGREMKKLKSTEGITSAFEGIVFQYDDKVYKFTGNFGPINQILGMMRYGRGPVGPLMKEEGDPLEPSGDITVLVPGSFKPPSIAHMQIVKQYADYSDRVIVFVSPLPRSSKDGAVSIDYDKSAELWNIYLAAYGLTDKVDVLESPVNSPVGAAYQYIANQEDREDWAQAGDRVVVGVGGKDNDAARFEGDLQQYAREGVHVYGIAQAMEELNIPSPTVITVDGQPASSSDMREVLSTGAANELEKYLPSAVRPRFEEIFKLLVGSKERPLKEDAVRRMVRQTLLEGNEDEEK